ncbi:MAG: LamG domain-containing protein [Candidatus Helarchaeota archaeon]
MAGINENTVLMLHFDGIDGSTTFVDDSPSEHTINTAGTANPEIDTADSVFGGASALYAISDVIYIDDSTDWDFGSGEFTIDFRLKFSSGSNPPTIVHQGINTNYVSWQVIVESDGSLKFVYTTNGSSKTTIDSNYNLSTGTWYHVAIVRDSNTLRIFVDGDEKNTADMTGVTIYNSPTVLQIGRVYAPGYGSDSSSGFAGWLDELRIQKGEAYWTSNFTPPSEAYSEDTPIEFNETVNLSDNWQIISTNQEFNLIETVVLSDDWNFDVETKYAQQIISYNPLIYVTNTDPAQIVHIDVSNPSSPVKTVYTLSGVKNAKGVVFNDTNDYFYVICDEGKIVKVSSSNLTNQTIINTSDTDTFQETDSLDSHLRTFVSTNNSNGEIIMIDEAEIKSINTDLRWLKQVEKTISTRLDTINGKLVNTDLRWIAETTKTIGCDLRWIKYAYDDINKHPINRTSDWVVKINGIDMVPLNDVQMNSITITHDINTEKTKGSIASFILNRRHDKLDYDNQGNSSQITNNNTVVININGREEFNGKIFNLSCDSQNETVTVTAKGTRPIDKRHTVNLPLASIGDNVHLYQCFLNNPIIDEPYLDTRQVIKGNNGIYWTGSAWDGDVTNALTFASYSAAESYIDGIADGNTVFHDQDPKVANYDDNPEYYKGITVDLGTKIEQNVIRFKRYGGLSELAEAIENGQWTTPFPNAIHFWFATFRHYLTSIQVGTVNLKQDAEDAGMTLVDYMKTDNVSTFDKIVATSDTILKYIGTSLGPLSGDIWEITGATYYAEYIQDDIETDLGSYQVGSAPYKKISVKNGKKITKNQWKDKKDGLYRIKDKGYDYEQYAKDVANIEYLKLKNINGDILPVTSAEIQVTLDGYYYYNIGLLTRINVTNTTTANIYKNNNGFPVSVKSITINSANMKVILNCSNQHSVLELDEIDENYPAKDSDKYIFEAESVRQYRKFDPSTWTYPE